MKKRIWIALIMVVGVIVALFGILIGLRSDRQSGIKIGVLSPLTGNRASYGSSLVNGLTLAVEEINSASGMNSVDPLSTDFRRALTVI